MLTALWSGRADVCIGGQRLRGDALTAAVGAVAARVGGARRVAVVAEPCLQTVVAVAGVLAAGACAVPLNPASGDTERAHVLRDAAPDLVLTSDDIAPRARAALPGPASPDGPALVVYTSGTTGPPKGAVLSRRAVVACL